MTKWVGCGAAVAAIGVGMAGASGRTTAAVSLAEDEVPRVARPAAEVARWNAAAADLFAAACATQPRGNVGLFVPALKPALDLLGAGAAGATRAQWEAALGAADLAGDRARLAALRATFGERFDAGARAWVEESLELDAGWQEQLAAQAGAASVERFALARLDRAALADAVNLFASRVVDEPLEIVREEDLGGLIRLVLACAARVEWRWAKPFDPKWTKEQPFHPGPRADMTITAPTMQLRDRFHCFDVGGLPGARLECEGGLTLDLVRVGFEPEARAKLLAGRDWLARIEAAVARGEQSSILLALPQVESLASCDLRAALESLGATAAFDAAQADFSRLGGRPGDLFVGALRHVCGVQWHEEGGKAFGATAAVLHAKSEPRELRFDVPFLALLRDSDGALLLAQWIATPGA